jgi:DUF1365 family protein
MTAMASALYAGEVIHQRHSPRKHRLRYRMFQILLDLDELPQLSRRLLLFSHDKLGVFSFYDKDHGDGVTRPLREYVEEQLVGAGLRLDGGHVFLLCMPRIFGFVFNPLSIYYCYRGDGGLVAIIYEVNNTFGQRHAYLIPADKSGATIRQSCDKVFHVSPFMDMDMTYDFALTSPGPMIATTINARDATGKPVIHAAFTGRRRELTDSGLLTALLTYPLLTLGVVVAIHWEALKLLAKGLRLRDLPPPPSTAVTVVRATSSLVA